MHTRNTTKKLIEVGNGIYGFVSLSETGEGIHTHFQYSEAPTERPDSKPSFSDYRLATAISTDSLFSISSGSSSDQSMISSTFDGSLSPILSSSSHLYHNLQRTSARRWIRDSETGQLHMVLENDSCPSIQTTTSSQSGKMDEDQIFEREYETFMKNHQYMVNLTKKLIAMEEMDEDIASDTLQMFTNVGGPPIEKASQVASKSNKQALGPKGTELIDEYYRPPPAEPGVYPQRWVTHRSTLLQSQPTESDILLL